MASMFSAMEEPGATYGSRRGTGLGLAICQRLVTLMGGRIWVESLTDGGVVFGFTVQMSRTEATPLRVSSHGSDVLIIDSNPVNRLIIGDLVTKCGHVPAVVATAEHALRRAH